MKIGLVINFPLPCLATPVVAFAAAGPIFHPMTAVESSVLARRSQADRALAGFFVDGALAARAGRSQRATSSSKATGFSTTIFTSPA